MVRKIAFISEYYSSGMGYTENCLPLALKKIGYDVRVFSSTLNVYSLSSNYSKFYETFLGPREIREGIYEDNGIKVIRMPYINLNGYIDIPIINKYLKAFKPDIIQLNSPSSLVGLRTVLGSHKAKYFTECHQHLSVAKPLRYYKKCGPHKYVLYFMTRTLIGKYIAQKTICCFSIAPDCSEVAESHYGVPKSKIVYIPLGTDIDKFHPARNIEEYKKRQHLRISMGVDDSAILIIYTGRLSHSKNPIILANAIQILRAEGEKVFGLFIGDGELKQEIMEKDSCKVIPFQRYNDLPEYYRAADIAIWPREESMSMLDALASGLPLIVSDRMGDPERVKDCGIQFKYDDINSLIESIRLLLDREVRETYKRNARRKAEDNYSWEIIARKRAAYYEQALYNEINSGV